MAYFAALLARSGDGWVAKDLELDDVDDLDGLADTMRAQAEDEEPVLLLLEQEDTWFGVVRVDGEDDPRVFVSDAAAARRSAYGEILLPDPAGAPVDSFDAPDPDEEEDDDGPRLGPEPVGEADLLADLGTSAEELIELCEQEGRSTGDALLALAERAGCAEELEAIR